MIERRIVIPWSGRSLGEHLDLARTSLPVRQSLLCDASEADSAEPAPWGYRDLGMVALWTASIATATILGMIVVRLLVSLVFLVGEMVWLVPDGAYNQLTAAAGPYSNVLTDLIVGAGLYGGLVFGVYRQTVVKYGLSLRALGFERVSRRTIGRVAVVFVPVTLAGVAINLASQRVLGSDTHVSQISVLTRDMSASAGNFAILSLLLVVLAPVAEEVFFRGFLFRMLRSRYSSWVTIGATSVAFAALHGSPTVLPWLVFMGAVFGTLVEKTHSLYSSIILHAMVNGLTLLGVVLAMSWS